MKGEDQIIEEIMEQLVPEIELAPKQVEDGLRKALALYREHIQREIEQVLSKYIWDEEAAVFIDEDLAQPDIDDARVSPDNLLQAIQDDVKEILASS